MRAKGLELYEPKGGYFVWVKGQLTMGKPGQELTIQQDRCEEHTRLCFSWLSHDDLLEGLRLLEKGASMARIEYNQHIISHNRARIHISMHIWAIWLNLSSERETLRFRHKALVEVRCMCFWCEQWLWDP